MTSFYSYVQVKDEPQLWLASLDEGLKHPLVAEENIYSIWFDDQHIVYAYSRELPFSNIPEPVFLMNVNSTQKVHLGLTTRQTQLQRLLVANQVAFLNQHELHIINLGLGTNLTAELQATLPIAERSFSTDRQTTKSEEPDPFYAYYFRRSAKISPDAQKVVILKTAYDKGTLTILDRQSKHKTILAENIAAPSEEALSWSPDSTRLVYTLIPTDTYIPELWMVNMADLKTPQLLMTGPGCHTFDSVTWLPDRDEVLFIYIPTGVNPINHSIYQVINVQTGEYRELFTNGSNLQLSLTDDGYRIIFRREYVNHQLDFSTWIATLSY